MDCIASVIQHQINEYYTKQTAFSKGDIFHYFRVSQSIL